MSFIQSTQNSEPRVVFSTEEARTIVLRSGKEIQIREYEFAKTIQDL